MSEVMNGQLFSWILYATLLFVFCILTINKLSAFSRICLRGVMGTSFIFIINCLLYVYNICLGINALTVAVSAVMGVPGIALMYLLIYIF